MTIESELKAISQIIKETARLRAELDCIDEELICVNAFAQDLMVEIENDAVKWEAERIVSGKYS